MSNKAPKSTAAAAANTTAPEKPGDVESAVETSTGDAVISSTQGDGPTVSTATEPVLAPTGARAPVTSFSTDAPGGGAPAVAASGAPLPDDYFSQAEPIRLAPAQLGPGSNDGDALARVSLPGSRPDQSTRPRMVEVIERSATVDPIAAELADAGLVPTKAKSNLLVDNLAVAAGAEVALDPRTYRELREIEAVEAATGRT